MIGILVKYGWPVANFDAPVARPIKLNVRKGQCRQLLRNDQDTRQANTIWPKTQLANVGVWIGSGQIQTSLNL